jgi:hypothetical protein
MIVSPGLRLGWRVRQRQAAGAARPASGGFGLSAAAIDAVALAATPIHAKARPMDTKLLLTKASRLEIA